MSRARLLGVSLAMCLGAATTVSGSAVAAEMSRSTKEHDFGAFWPCLRTSRICWISMALVPGLGTLEA